MLLPAVILNVRRQESGLKIMAARRRFTAAWFSFYPFDTLKIYLMKTPKRGINQ